MANYSISLKHLPIVVPGLLRWCLDYPKDKQNSELVELTEKGLVFQGWLLTQVAQPVAMYIQQGPSRTPLTLDRSRPDVISAILHEASESHSQLRCGFRAAITMTTSEFLIGVTLEGKDYRLAEGTISGPFKVLTGKDGWLFLDNDTNKSVEQFTGKLLLDRAERKAWKNYFSGFTTLATELDKPVAMLMAPAKEAVYTEYYPYPKAKHTTVDQLQEIVPSTFPFIYPVKELSLASQRTFRITDSHWSVHGAMLASLLTANTLGVPHAVVDAIFAKDEFYQRQVSGDLGNKIFPPAMHNEDALKNYSYKKKLVYDNQLPNFGRVLVLQNDDALVPGRLLVLGSSSAYSMLDYLSRIFRNVVLIHTAGNIDTALVKKIKPDFLLAQTNSRFVVRAPDLGFSLEMSIAEKLKNLDKKQLIAAFEMLETDVRKANLDCVTLLHEVYRAAMSKLISA